MLATAANATATPFTLGGSYQYGVSADGQGFGPVHQDLGPVSQDILELPTVAVPFEGRYGSTASVAMSGSVTAGTLHGLAADSADVRLGNELAGTIGANGHVDLELYFTDTLTFHSDTLAAGAPIEYTAEYVLDSFFTTDADGGSLCRAGAPIGQISLDNMLALGGVLLVNTPCDVNTHLVSTLAESSVVGADALVSERLRIHTDARNQPGIPYEAIGANAANTAHLFITVNTPGVTFTSASGGTYALPQDTTPGPALVPEPATLTLVGGGVLALVARRRRLSTSRS